MPIYIYIYNQRFENSEQLLIAHAGGGIDGDKYTNSLESVEKSLSDGFDAFELDLMLSSDSVPVATHDWALLRKHSGHKYDGDTLTYSQYLNLKLLGKYTPIDWHDWDSIMVANPNVVFVLDKISNPKIVHKYFGKYKDRIKIECFSISDYYELKNMGYEGVALSGFPDPYWFLVEELKYMVGLSDRRIERFVLDPNSYEYYRKYVRWWCSPKTISLFGKECLNDYYVEYDVESVYVDYK